MTAVLIALAIGALTYHLETRAAHRRQRESEAYCVRMRVLELEGQRVAAADRELDRYLGGQPTLEDELDRINHRAWRNGRET